MIPTKRYLLAFLCAFFFTTTFGQVSYQQFKNQSDLNLKSELGLELWNYYTRSDLDSLKIAAIDLLLVAAEKEHQFARAVGSRMLGGYLYRTGKIEQGLEYLRLSLGFFEQREDFVVASEVWNEIGHAYQLSGALNKAKEAYNKSLRLGEQSNDATAAFNAKLGLGRAYILAGDTATGMSIWHSYKQSSLESEKYESASNVYAFMAMIETERGNEALSAEYYDRSIGYANKSASKSHKANTYANIGIRKFGLGEMDSSLFYFERSLELRLELSNMRQILEGYYNLGFYYLSVDSLEQSINYFETGRKKAEEHELYTELNDFLDELIGIYQGLEKEDQVNEFKNRKVEIKELLEKRNTADDNLLEALDLEFSGKKDKMSLKAQSGIDWKLFTIVVLVALALLFLFLERKRFS